MTAEESARLFIGTVGGCVALFAAVYVVLIRPSLARDLFAARAAVIHEELAQDVRSRQLSGGDVLVTRFEAYLSSVICDPEAALTELRLQLEGNIQGRYQESIRHLGVTKLLDDEFVVLTSHVRDLESAASECLSGTSPWWPLRLLAGPPARIEMPLAALPLLRPLAVGRPTSSPGSVSHAEVAEIPAAHAAQFEEMPWSPDSARPSVAVTLPSTEPVVIVDDDSMRLS